MTGEMKTAAMMTAVGMAGVMMGAVVVTSVAVTAVEDVLMAVAVMKAKAVTVGEMKPVTVRMAAKFIAG